MPKVGIEPTYTRYTILSRARLPVPPLRLNTILILYRKSNMSRIMRKKMTNESTNQYRSEHMGTGILCRETDTSVPVPMCVKFVLNKYLCHETDTNVPVPMCVKFVLKKYLCRETDTSVPVPMCVKFVLKKYLCRETDTSVPVLTDL